MICRTCREAGKYNKLASKVTDERVRDRLIGESVDLHNECPAVTASASTLCDCQCVTGYYVVERL